MPQPAEPLTFHALLRLDADTLLTPAQVAQALECSEASLARWRKKPGGPAFIEVAPCRVIYRAGDVAAYVRASRPKKPDPFA